jgi:hypothetical protein
MNARGKIMRYRMSAVLTAACLAVVGTNLPPASAADQPGSGGMVMRLDGKDGKSYEIHVPAPNGKPQNVEGLDDLFSVFLDFCLEAFPDDAAVAAKAKSGAHPELSPEQLNSILHGDPGRGWVVRLNHSAVTLTVEQPPYHSCGVRAALRTEPDIGLKTATYVGLWGFGQSPPETLLPGPAQSHMTGSVMQTMQPFVLVGPDRRPIEQIGAYFAHDPNSEQVQLRLVRMRGNNPH